MYTQELAAATVPWDCPVVDMVTYCIQTLLHKTTPQSTPVHKLSYVHPHSHGHRCHLVTAAHTQSFYLLVGLLTINCRGLVAMVTYYNIPVARHVFKWLQGSRVSCSFYRPPKFVSFCSTEAVVSIVLNIAVTGCL